MARPRRDQPLDRFTTSELAAAAGVTPRNVALLDDRGLLPPGEGEGGKGGVRMYDTRTLKHVAIIGALHSAGVELLLSARLMQAIAEEVEHTYGGMPGNLFIVLRENGGPYPRIEDVPSGYDEDYWLHRWILRHGLLRPGQALLADFYLELADREFAFIGNIRPPGVQLHGGEGSEAAFRVISWERGDIAEILPVALEAGNLSTPEGQANLARVTDRYLAARRNALGLLRVNLSLAIRTALDRLADFRSAR